MKTFEKLDNEGNPTGEIQNVSEATADRLLRIRNCKWKLIEKSDQPKQKRITKEDLTNKPSDEIDIRN